MDTHSYLEILVTDRLGGDKSRVVELFDDDEVYRNLVVLDVTGGWLNYKNNLNDGWHLIEHFGFYDVYYQERGAILERRRFKSSKKQQRFSTRNRDMLAHNKSLKSLTSFAGTACRRPLA